MDLVRNNPQGNTPNNTSGNGNGANAQADARGQAAARPQRARVVTPPVDVFEGPEAILVLADLPGVAADALTIRLEKDELSVQGQRTDLAEPVEYRRVFAIPSDVDGEGIGAELSRGVLKLTLPRKASAKPRQIPVRGA
jgi:HSP20 family protein